MRMMSKVFEAGGVDIVFYGHAHNYQRTFPLRFQAKVNAPDPLGGVDGDWRLYKNYDGKFHTKPDGVIYVITGAGGGRLFNPEQQNDPANWQAFTNKLVSQVNSFTVVDGVDDRLSIRQVSKDGQELDRFVVTKIS
jgi:hypothetical protein